MMFCPKCGSILTPKKENRKIVVKCPCGYSKNSKQVKIKEDIKKSETVSVVTEDFEIHPIVDADCSKCGNKKAYFWEIQTRASDEPATSFFKCTKCKAVWRDYN